MKLKLAGISDEVEDDVDIPGVVQSKLLSQNGYFQHLRERGYILF